MKGAAKKITAFKEWSNDKAMAKRFPRAMFTQVPPTRLGTVTVLTVTTPHAD